MAIAYISKIEEQLKDNVYLHRDRIGFARPEETRSREAIARVENENGAILPDNVQFLKVS